LGHRFLKMSYKSLSKGLDACKVVVTGGAGLIGSSLVSRLRSIGVEVYAFDSQDFIDSSIYNATLDLLDPNFLRYLDDIQPSIVVHTAAHPGGTRGHRRHLGGLNGLLWIRR